MEECSDKTISLRICDQNARFLSTRVLKTLTIKQGN